MASTTVFEDLVVENSALVATALAELRDRVFWLELRNDRLQQALDFVIPRFNGFFRYESDARAAWEAFTIVLGEPDRPFPQDAPDTERGAANFYSKEASV